MGKLEGKRALVTGGGSGIGEAITRRFVQEGARVLVAERDPSTRDRVERTGASFQVCDVADPAQIGTAVERARTEFGGLDVVVANAGYELVAHALELTYEQWDAHQAVLLRGVFATFKSALPLMIEQGGGSLIAVGSQLAFVALERFTSYLAAKSGVIGLVRGIAMDFAKYGVRCNALCPGPTMTPMIERQLEGKPNRDELLATWASSTMLGRLGRPEEIASGAVFLASDESSFMTGASLVIDGGYIAR
ncbi:MAG TPA: SDR family oxidoreductase [Actinomycetota bacterium]|nr:SDR family oxidoreductase [Actinomycetota bacterium]